MLAPVSDASATASLVQANDVPLDVTLIAPLLLPLHLTGVATMFVNVGLAFIVAVTGTLWLIHPLPSVTVT